jgi:pyruvate/2-oxoglutarate dehydrogenase complex dihydrolipoamide acyltransferase (E2) component
MRTQVLLLVATLLVVLACSESASHDPTAAGESAPASGESAATDAAATDPAAADPAAAADAGSAYLVDADKVAALARGDLDFEGVGYHCDFCEKEVTRDDAAATASAAGIVWYGLWEDALAEVQRTGKPLLLHFGSPRVMQVCGVW